MVAIVILPGLDGTGQLLDDFVRNLGPDADTQVVAYPADEELGYEQLSNLVARVLPLGKAFVLVAESFSGPVAVRIAAQAPPGLVGVVFCASFVSCPLPALRFLSALVRLAPVRAIPATVLAGALLGRWSSHVHVARLDRALRSVPPRVLRARARAALSAVQPRTRIDLPVLYLRAESDRLISHASFELLRLVAPSATVQTIPGPHFLLQAAPEVCADAVRSFATRIAPRF